MSFVLLAGWFVCIKEMEKKILFLLFCLITTSCNSEKEVDKVDNTYTVINSIVKDAIYSREYVAEIHSVRYVEIRSKIKGYIEEIYVDEGQPVQEGQLLFRLRYLEFEKELQKANAAYKSIFADLKAAEVDLTNVKRLVQKDIVSKSELDVAKAKVEALKADLEEAAANKEQVAVKLSLSQIRAPYRGFINRIPNKVGSLIAEGDMLTSISDNREVFAYFNLSEIDYLNYVATGEKQHKSVQLKLANNALYDYEGKIEMIASEFDSATGNIAFRARFPNPDGLLKHGSHGKVIVNEQLENALLIPQKSTFEIQDRLYVYVVNQDGVLEQRNIIEKMRLPDFYVVESGLSRGERILYEGAENMRDGDKIHAVNLDLTNVMLSSNRD